MKEGRKERRGEERRGEERRGEERRRKGKEGERGKEGKLEEGILTQQMSQPKFIFHWWDTLNSPELVW